MAACVADVHNSIGRPGSLDEEVFLHGVAAQSVEIHELGSVVVDHQVPDGPVREPVGEVLGLRPLGEGDPVDVLAAPCAGHGDLGVVGHAEVMAQRSGSVLTLPVPVEVVGTHAGVRMDHVEACEAGGGGTEVPRSSLTQYATAGHLIDGDVGVVLDRGRQGRDVAARVDE